MDLSLYRIRKKKGNELNPSHCAQVKNHKYFPCFFHLPDFISPFLANVPVLYSLQTTENLWFSGVSRGYKMGTLARNELSNVWLDVYPTEAFTKWGRDQTN